MIQQAFGSEIFQGERCWHWGSGSGVRRGPRVPWAARLPWREGDNPAEPQSQALSIAFHTLLPPVAPQGDSCSGPHSPLPPRTSHLPRSPWEASWGWCSWRPAKTCDISAHLLSALRAQHCSQLLQLGLGGHHPTPGKAVFRGPALSRPRLGSQACYCS